MRANMRPLWVKKWDKVEIRQRAEEQGCFMADVVKGLLDQGVEAPEGMEGRRFTDRKGRTRLLVYKRDMVRLKALKKNWGVYLHQVISHLLAEMRGKEAAPETGAGSGAHAVWGEMVRRAEGYRRQIAEYEVGQGFV